MGVFLNGFLKAQDTIPFLDPCFSYPTLHEIFYPWVELPLDTLRHKTTGLSLNNTAIENWSYRHNNKIQKESVVYGIAIASPNNELPEGVVCKLCTYDENSGYFYYDSVHSNGNHFVKHMFYQYNSTILDYGVDQPISPCQIYLFNHEVSVHDSIFYSTFENHYGADYYIYDVGLNPVLDAFDLVCGSGPNNEVTGMWGIVFPILKLPCPAPRVRVGTNFSGRVEFHWNPGGDTMLYQLAFHSADDGRLMFETDTLTDTTFTLVDSIAPAEMVNGRYEVRVRKACDYTGAPILNPLVWSDWSEPRTFNYMHRVEGIEDIESFGPQFTLSPNPAKGTVTVEGAAEVERVEIVDMEGRVVIGERPLAGSPSTVDISHLAPGVYLVRLSGPTGSATRKLVVE